MKILNAETKYGGIRVEYEILGETHKLLFPLEYTDEQIKEDLNNIEAGRKKRVRLQEDNKERLEKESAAQKTCEKLLK